jgi:AcrR family transcriptional regulator
VSRTRSDGYDDQRTLILDRAAELFANRGYPATTMNELAGTCGVSKAALYHYYRDKHAILVAIAETHVARLGEIADGVDTSLAPPERLTALITAFMNEYADAQHAHRVLTEDVRFLNDTDRQRVLDTERRVVAQFAAPISEMRPDLADDGLTGAITMLLFGMLNWMFTWFRREGPLNHAAMAPIVAGLFIGGLQTLLVGKGP